MLKQFACLLFTILATLAFGLPVVRADPPAEAKSPTLRIGDNAFTAEKVDCKPADDATAGKYHCAFEGKARASLFGGDIEIAADKIQLEMKGEVPVSIVCSGACSYQQVDADEYIWGDRLILGSKGLRVIGNARLEFGSDKNKTVLAAESITTGNGGFEFSGKAKLTRGR